MAEQYQHFLSLGEGRTLDSFASYLSAGNAKEIVVGPVVQYALPAFDAQ